MSVIYRARKLIYSLYMGTHFPWHEDEQDELKTCMKRFILILIHFDIIENFLFYSMAKRICKGNGCHAQHSNLCQLEHRYKDELKTCMKRNGQWIHNVTSWRRCCHWQIVFFCFVEWILLVRRKELRIHIIHFSISYISDL